MFVLCKFWIVCLHLVLSTRKRAGVSFAFPQALDSDRHVLYIFGGVTQLSPNVDESNSLWILDMSMLLSNASSSTTSPQLSSVPALNFTAVPAVTLQWRQLRQPSTAASSTGSIIASLTLACSWPSARNSARMAMMAGHVALSGGLQSEPSPDVALQDMWVFQPGTETWARYANLPAASVSVSSAQSNSPSARFAHSLNTVNGSLFRFDPPAARELQARTLRGSASSPELTATAPQRLLSVDASSGQDHSLVLFGGRFTSSSGSPVLGDTWVFDVLATSTASFSFSNEFSASGAGWAHGSTVGPGQAVGPLTPWGTEQLQACAALASPPLEAGVLSGGVSPAGNGPPSAAAAWPLGRWRRVDVPGVQFERSYHASAVWNNTLFLFGGFSLATSGEFTVGAVFGDTLALSGRNNAIGAPAVQGGQTASDGLQLGWNKLQAQSLGALAGLAAPAAAVTPSERFEAQAVFLPALLGVIQNITKDALHVTPSDHAVQAFTVFGGAFSASKGDVWALPGRNASWRPVQESDFQLDEDGITILDSTVFMIVLFSVVGLCFLGLAVGLYRRNRQRREMLAMLEDLMQMQAIRGAGSGESDQPLRRPGVRAELLAALPPVLWRKGVPPPKVPLPPSAAGAAEAGLPGRGYLVCPPQAGWNPPMADQTSCSVCLEEFADSAAPAGGGGREGGSQPLTALPCGHAFHRACIERWLGNHDDCPLCKSDVAKGITGESTSDSEGEGGSDTDATSAGGGGGNTAAEPPVTDRARRQTAPRGGGGGGGRRPARRSIQDSVQTVHVNPAANSQ